MSTISRSIGSVRRIGIFQGVLKLGAADAVFHGQVLHRLHVERDSVDLVQFGCKRRITSEASILRSSSGLRLIRMRPLFSVVLVPSTPMKEERLSTAGSLQDHCGQLPAAAAAMAGKETSCGASEMP